MKDIANKVDSVDTLPANAFNSIASELENAVTDSGQTLDATAETDPDPTPTQISRAITEAALSADFYTDSGAADVYVLTVSGSWRQPTAYVTGMAFRFIPDNANTGASTVNISGLGVKTIKQEDGTALLGGQLPAAKTAAIYYDGTDFKLIEAGGGAGGLGGVNLLEDEANAAAGVGNWVASGSTLAIAQETSTIPLNGVRDTAIKFTIGGTPNAGDYQAIRFTMSTALKDLLLGIKWFQQVSAYTVDALQVELYYNAQADYAGAYTEVPLSSDVAGDTFAPDANDPVSNITYLDMSQDYYELRFIVGAAAVGNEIVYINDLETGPDNIESGAAIGPWTAFTPTSQGFGVPTLNLEWKSSGGGIIVRGEVTLGTVAGTEAQLGLPAGMTVGGVPTNTILVANAQRSVSLAASNLVSVLATKGDAYLNFGLLSSSTSSNPLTPTGASTIFGSSERFSFTTDEIPIAELENTGVQHQLSNDLISSCARMRAERTNSSTISTTDTVIFEDETNDNVSAYDPVTGIYTTKSAGDFNVEAMFKFTATTTAVSVVSIEQNGTIVASRTFDTTGASGSQASIGISDTLSCAKGDTIEIVWAGDGTSPAFSLTAADNILTIERKADYSARQPVGFGLATDVFAGFVTREQTEIVAADGDFTAGNLVCSRVGNVVNITADAILTHSSNSAPASSSGLIPIDYRPSNTIYNVYFHNATIVGVILIDSAGQVTTAYRDWAGVLSAQVSSVLVPSTSYVVT